MLLLLKFKNLTVIPSAHACRLTPASRLLNAIQLTERAFDSVQYGQVISLIIPRPNPAGGPPPSGLGKVVIEYPDADSASKARMAMHNRRFAGRTVTAIYLNENSYAAGNLD